MKTPKDLKNYLDSLVWWKQHGLALLIIVIMMTIYFAPMLFQNQGPPASDIQAWEGASKSIREYNASHSDLALWASNIFSGMPASNISVPIPVYTLDSAINLLNDLLPWQYLYFIFGGFFFYLFLRILGLSWLSAMFGALIFLLIPHHVGLINAGHNTKLRAIMFSPFLAWTFICFVKNTSLLSFLILALALALEARTNHYQLVYYVGFIVLFLGLPYLVGYFRRKEWKKMGSQVGLLVIAILLAGIIAAPKLILTRQYLPYSIRGSSGETAQSAAGGLEKGYATQWSFPPEEMVTFVIPNFYGGTSQYEYTGDAVPQLQGRTIPAYWGKMPFTTSSEYLGILTVFLGFLGMFAYWKRRLVKSLAVMSILTLLISFGRHFSPVFDIFFNYFPVFDKFRVPSMILFLIEFSIAVFAAFGIEKLLHLHKDDIRKWVIFISGILGGLLLIGVVSLLIGGGLPFASAQEFSRYPEQTLQLLRTARLEILKADAWRLIVFCLLTAGVMVAYIQKHISRTVLYPVLAILMLIDMYTIDNRFLNEFVPQQADQSPFTQSQIDQYIMQDDGLFRVFPVGDLFGNNRWSYFHQSIGGYHAAKMHIYQKMVEENLYHSTESGNNINWNIVKLLNVKYVITTQRISSDHISAIGQDPNTNWILYQVDDPFPRAWMVYQTRIISAGQEQRQVLNQAGFDPRTEAIVFEDLLDSSTADGEQTGSAEVTHFDANQITVEVSTPREGLLVLSENYLPIWWQATLDGEAVTIHRVNSLQRGIVVPQGSHTVHFEIKAPLFHASILAGNITVWIVHGVILLLAGLRYLPVRSTGKSGAGAV